MLTKTGKRLCLLLAAVLLIVPLTQTSAETVWGPYEYDAITGTGETKADLLPSVGFSKAQKQGYELLNGLANAFLKVFNALYVNPRGVKSADAFDGSVYPSGRDAYRTSPDEGAGWKAGFASASLVPPDFEPGKYYIGRSLTNMPAEGVYDDCRVRAAAVDDGAGEGPVVFAVVDGLGVTGGDTLEVRKAVLDWAEANGIRISAVNLSATHTHTGLDTQGVATESIYKLLTGSIRNLFNIRGEKRLENAERFKAYYVKTVTETVKAAIEDMRPGTLSYKAVDLSANIMDKRGLVDTADIPLTPVFRFDPADGTQGIYIADIPCHPTSFDSSYHLVSADYVYYTEMRIKEKTGYSFLFFQGAAGMLTRKNTGVNAGALPEEERMGANVRNTGRIFADRILAACADMETLPPVLNVRYSTSLFSPTNGVLLLALKAGLVNEPAYRTGLSPNDISVVLELGYVEFGGRVGLCLFPVELYPEVFYGTSIINGGDYAAVSWTGKEETNPVPAALAPRAGVDLFAVHLTNDSLGYCVPDADFAFLGHILGDDNADEVLSLGKGTAKAVTEQFADLMGSIPQ
ncbi:MAG: hypothetical protein IJK02_09355 [Clostridia bacterium]|nr:hypothetical protein [Clostridia bacterium]